MQGTATGRAQEPVAESGPMTTRAHHTHPATTPTTRAITGASPAVLTAVLFAAAIFSDEIEFITAALLTGVVGIAVDVRHTKKPARTQASLTPWPTGFRC